MKMSGPNRTRSVFQNFSFFFFFFFLTYRKTPDRKYVWHIFVDFDPRTVFGLYWKKIWRSDEIKQSVFWEFTKRFYVRCLMYFTSGHTFRDTIFWFVLISFTYSFDLETVVNKLIVETEINLYFKLIQTLKVISYQS